MLIVHAWEPDEKELLLENPPEACVPEEFSGTLPEDPPHEDELLLEKPEEPGEPEEPEEPEWLPQCELSPDEPPG